MNPSLDSNEDQKLMRLSGYIDGELTQQEAQKVALLLDSDSEYQQLYTELKLMRNEVQSLSLQDKELKHLDKLFKEPIVKTSRIFGLALVFISAIAAMLLTLYMIFTHPELGLIEKGLVGLLGSGFMLLLVSVLRQRLLSLKNDKYKRVKL
ncbi:anti-sigma factor family protein [Aliikangiella sp. IMCC44653]